ncbi:TPA: pyridoxal-phosphate dependent enzyme [Klebsiella variicola subsp. variicola]
MQLHINTPLIQFRQLSRDVWLKMEALQPTGSFKIRCVGLACQEYYRQGARYFISSSGGNAGLAVAYAGCRLGVPVSVVVPETTSAQAEVVVHGSSWQEANQYALRMAGASDAFIHPFDDPLLWKGHASMIDEVVASGLCPDVVVLAVGGGGPLCGVIEGLERNGLGNVPVIAAETEGTASFHAASAAGHLVELDAIDSVATSLGAKRVCEQVVDYARSRPVINQCVTDAEAVRACRRFADDHRVVTETPWSVFMKVKGVLEPYRTPLFIVCGGLQCCWII